MRLILAAAGALALGACATPTPYQPFAAEQGGYREEKLGEARYRVTFAGNEATSPEQVGDHLLRRASELTLNQGYDWFVVANRAVEGDIHEIQTRYGKVRVSRGPGYESWRNYGRVYTSSGFGLVGPIWRSIRSGGGERLEASAEITLGRGPAPQQDGVFDARRVLQEMAE